MNEELSVFKEHQDHMARIAKALIELCEASEAEREWWKKAESEGQNLASLVSGVYIGTNPDLLESPECKPAHWIRQLIQHGYITPEEIPVRYRNAWGLDLVSVKNH